LVTFGVLDSKRKPNPIADEKERNKS